MPRLIIEEGIQKGREYRFQSEAVIGRGKDCLVTLSDPKVSRYHAKINVRGDGIFIEDQGSRNGTFVNGVRKTDAHLAIGDAVAVGQTSLRVAEDVQGEWAGRVLGGYELLDMVGEGGMGSVYKARQLSLDRIVALKVIHPRLAQDPKYIQRFISEARAAARLNHPSIIHVHDVGEDDGAYFFSMEYVEGASLLGRLREGKEITPPETARILARVAEGLAYSHERGIIHRDVKPDNIILSADGEVKLGDLGIAKRVEEVDVFEEQGKRMVLGTPKYMAPEAAAGREIDPRSDQYSLGATAYHLLAGRPPFTGKSSTEVLRRLLREDPVPLSSLNPEAPRALCRVVERMMAKRPQDRYPDARAAAQDLDRFHRQTGEEKTDGTVSASVRVAALRRKGVPAIAPVLVMGGILAAAGAFFYRQVSGLHNPPPSPPPVVTGSETPPSEPVDAAEHWRRGEEALEAGRLREAADWYGKGVEAAPESQIADRSRGRLEEIATTLERAAQQEEARDAWREFQERSFDSPEDAVVPLRTWLARYGETPLAQEARRELERVEGILNERELERRRSERFRKTLEQARGAMQEGDFLQGMREWEMFLRTDAGSYETQAREELDRIRERIRSEWEEAKTRIQGWLRGGDSGRAYAELQGALPRFPEGLFLRPEVEALEREVRGVCESALEAGRETARERLARFEFGKGQEELEKLRKRLEGSPWEEEAAELLEKSRALGELHGEVLDRIRSEKVKPAFRLEKGVPEAGSVTGATESGVQVEVRGLRVEVSWSNLAEKEPKALYELYRHYLDKRLKRTHSLLAVFCRHHGLWNEAREELRQAGFQ